MKTLIIAMGLLLSGSLVAAQNIGSTLYNAVVKGDTAAISRLITAGANVNFVKEEGFVKVSPLITAVNKNNIDVAAKLINAKADVNWKDGFNTTALMYAASGGYEQIVKLLIYNGADVFAKDGQGNDVLSAADESKNTAIIKLIKEAQRR